MQWQRGAFTVTDDRNRIDPRRTHELLLDTYWGVRRPYDTVLKLIDSSVCFTVLEAGAQLGFGRAVTDTVTISWIADVVVDPRYRGQGLGTWLMACICEHPAVAGTQMILQTRDAHGLYEKFGFSRSPALMSTAVDGL